ncbi:unnamed protein product [Peronospora farinosa]|uniref:Uncharacterized protein n=1 Tax=Peronospora farinosa TaxID=134698 RepID=A0ABN8C368_9STRA|nr:unnamed protein product [Peronospora farinosa]
MTFSGMEEMVDVNNLVKTYKTLKLHKNIPSRNERYDAWIKYSEKTSSDTLKAELESSGRDGEEIFLKVLKAFIIAGVHGDIQTKLETALLESWKKRKLGSLGVFRMLKLDKPIDPMLYITLLPMWVKYSKNNIRDMSKAVSSFRGNIRLRNDKLSAENLFTELKPFEEGHSDFYSYMWAKYVLQASDPLKDIKLAIPKVLEIHGDEGLLKMLDALEKEHVEEDIQGELKSALMTSWKNQSKSADDVFKLLKLDVKPDPTHPMNVKRLSLWVMYMEKYEAMPETRMTEVIGHYDLDFALMVNDGLRETRHIYAARFLHISLVDRLQHFEGGYKDRVVQVFKILKLDNGLDKLLDKPNLDLFYRYAEKYEWKRTKEASLITAARTVYEDIPLRQMLKAALKNDDTARLLLQELDKVKGIDPI